MKAVLCTKNGALIIKQVPVSHARKNGKRPAIKDETPEPGENDAVRSEVVRDRWDDRLGGDPCGHPHRQEREPEATKAVSEEYEQGAELSGLNLLDIPPRGQFLWRRTEWKYTHQEVYVVQVAALGIADDRWGFLRTVLMTIIEDAELDGIDFNDLVVEAREHYDEID
jgi:hypothetical protein